MAFESLTSELTLDASDYTSGADDAASASDDLASSAAGTSDSLFDLDPAGMAAGAGLAGVATASQGLLDSNRDMREGLSRTATTMGITSSEATDLATSMSDATFPLEDVEGTMASLSSQGVRTEEDMRRVATQMDEIADATGSTAESIADSAGPALRAFGHELEDAGEHADTFTFIAQNTTMDVEEFSGAVERLAPEIQEMGLGLDETAEIMAALEAEGITGRQAIREFRQASNEADGDLDELIDTLGLSEEAIEEQSDALEDAEGITEEHADAVNENVTVMDGLRSSFADAQLQAAQYLGPLQALIPAAQAAGVAMIGMSSINFGQLAPSFAAVSAAALPISAVILGLAAAAALLYAAWSRDLGGIQDKSEAVFDFISGGMSALVDTVTWAFDTLDFILTEWDPRESVRAAIGGLIGLFPTASDMIDVGTGIVDGVIEGVIDGATRLIESITNPINSAIDRINDVIPSEIPRVEVGPVGGGEVSTGALGDLPGVASSVSVPEFGPWGAGPADLPGIPIGELATGGIVESEGAVWAGEEGPEAVLNADQTADVRKGEVDLGGRSRTSEIVEEIRALRSALASMVVRVEAGDETLEQVMSETAEVLIDARENQRFSDFRA